METTVVPDDRRALKLKFAGLYILTIALTVFIMWFLVPRYAPANTGPAANSPENDDLHSTDLLNKAEVLTVQYQKIKQLDQNYARKIIDSVNTSELDSLALHTSDAEKKFIKTIDSIEIISRAYPDSKASKLLHAFVESFKDVMNDRSSVQAYKTAVLKGNADSGLQSTLRLQDEIQARNSRIEVLESYIKLFEGRSIANVSIANNAVINQQNTDLLRSTISAQDKKIASLTAANAALESEARANTEALEQARKSADSNPTASKNQTALFEKRINDMNTEIRLAQVDCSLSRVDATQMISNAKQRKAILADALNTLNTLGANGDVILKKKVSDKIIRLNQVASTLHD